MALAYRAAAYSLYGWVFFDRGLIDALRRFSSREANRRWRR
jgi:hypothetical protein